MSPCLVATKCLTNLPNSLGEALSFPTSLPMILTHLHREILRECEEEEEGSLDRLGLGFRV